jgi:tetratricopeptide (TPR) repeat protein
LKGELNPALSDFDRAIELDPRLVAAYVNRGSVKVATYNLEAALVDFDRAIELDPSIADVYQNRGIAYLLLGRKSEAERDFIRCLELNPSLKPTLDLAIRTAQKRLR